MMLRGRRGLVGFLGVVIGLGCSKPAPGTSDAAPADSAPPAATTAPSGAPSGARAAANDGTDPKNPVLSPDDVGFKDTRKGMGWGDRCFTEYKAGKLGWARAACDAGLALPEVDAKARPPLLFNEGLIAKAAGDTAGARNYFTQSLTLRPADDPGIPLVEKELRSVGGTPPPASNVIPADAKLECKVKNGATVVELFVRPATSVADSTGVLRTTAPAAPPVVKPVKTELYKGLLVVHPADSSDLSNVLATVSYDPSKTMQVGNGRHSEPTLPCQ